MSEVSLRLLSFLMVFGTVAVAEHLIPFRKALVPVVRRWGVNLSLTLLNSIFLRLIFPVGAVGFAGLVEEKGWGIFPYFGLANWFSVVLAVVLLDGVIYFQHRLFHRVPFLWRLHRMHHTDIDFDVTTGTRFHPIEMFLSLGIKLLTILVFGLPAQAVLVFEILLNASSLFNHGNFSLPQKFELQVRSLIVTPNMHRIHHSISVSETDTNFGFCLSIWDRIFNTYLPRPQGNPDTMPIGLDQFRSLDNVSLLRLLRQPFLED